MKHLTGSNALLPNAFSALRDTGGIVLEDAGKPFAVVMRIEDYRALRGAAELASEPDALIEAWQKSAEFESGDNEGQTYEHMFEHMFEEDRVAEATR